MSNYREIVFDFFLERHIVLKEEWLNECLSFCEDQGLLRNKTPRQVCSLIFEQWLCSDLEDSSYPSIEQNGIDLSSRKCELTAPLVVQMRSIVDIGSPLNSQFNKLTFEFVDNSGFEALPEQEEKNRWEQAPKRCLLMEADDGTQKIRLVEYKKIPFLSLMTAPGAKLLLLPGTVCRRGILLLKATHIQLIGGDCDKWAETGRPVQVMAQRLGITVPQGVSLPSTAPPSIPSSSSIPAPPNHSRSRNMSMIVPNPDTSLLDDDDFDNDIGPDLRVPQFMDAPVVDEDSMDSFDYRPVPVIRQPRQTHSSDPRVSASPIVDGPSCSKPVASVGPIAPQVITSHHPLPNVSVRIGNSEDTIPSTSNGEQREQPINNSRRRPSTSSSNNTKNGGIQQFLQRRETGSPPSKRACDGGMFSRVKVKSEPIEIIDLDGSFEVRPEISNLNDAYKQLEKGSRLQSIALPKSDISTPRTKVDRNSSRVSFQTPHLDVSRSSGRGATSTEEPDHPLIESFKNLKITLLSVAISDMRYAIGSSRKNVQALIQEVIEPLRILDGLWTMKVKLRDESVENIECVVDSHVLNELIGLTPDEAMTIRSSSDMERRREGSAKLASVQEAMERLDLIIQVEFFSKNRVSPVIRSIQTMAQKLDFSDSDEEMDF